MMPDFDEIISREGTSCVKYDLRPFFFGSNDVIPLWVADMDFRTPRFIIDALKLRLEHEILGYSFRPDSYFQALIEWQKRRHNWNIEKEWILFSPGVVPALNMSVLSLTNPGDKIVIQPPVYAPFFEAVQQNGRELVENPLVQNESGRFEMNFSHLESLFQEGVKMMILSNPHNPCGTVWSFNELEKLSRLCIQYSVLVLSDEIHCDLVYRSLKHIPLATMSNEIANQTITAIAASKTFNIAGLSTSSLVISNPDLRAKVSKQIDDLHIWLGNIFGNIATEVAYKEGDDWLESLMVYLKENVETVCQWAGNHSDKLSVFPPEATYMMWLDFRKSGLSNADLRNWMIKKAGLGLNSGIEFGTGGDGFMRLNIACPRLILRKALNQIEQAFTEL